MNASGPQTVCFTIRGPIARTDLPGLCDRVCVLLHDTDAEVVDCEVEGVGPDAVTVDALARLQLAARRLGCRVRLRGASDDLRALVAFMGLTDVFPTDEGGAMATLDISISLDGFVAGPNATLEQPLGEGGERLHEWIVGLASWRESHGRTGGATGPDDDLVREARAATGAYVMGRRMFSGGSGPWEDDPNADGWWGDSPPFGVPVFVVTHHARETVEKDGGTTFTFVTDGIEAAFERAQAAAGGRTVMVAGGADVAGQALAAGLLDELQIHVAPVLLGGGVRLFEGLGPLELEQIRVVDSPAAAHLQYRVVK